MNKNQKNILLNEQPLTVLQIIKKTQNDLSLFDIISLWLNINTFTILSTDNKDSLRDKNKIDAVLNQTKSDAYHKFDKDFLWNRHKIMDLIGYFPIDSDYIDFHDLLNASTSVNVITQTTNNVFFTICKKFNIGISIYSPIYSPGGDIVSLGNILLDINPTSKNGLKNENKFLSESYLTLDKIYHNQDTNVITCAGIALLYDPKQIHNSKYSLIVSRTKNNSEISIERITPIINIMEDVVIKNYTDTCIFLPKDEEIEDKGIQGDETQDEKLRSIETNEKQIELERVIFENINTVIKNINTSVNKINTLSGLITKIDKLLKILFALLQSNKIYCNDVKSMKSTTQFEHDYNEKSNFFDMLSNSENINDISEEKIIQMLSSNYLIISHEIDSLSKKKYNQEKLLKKENLLRMLHEDGLRQLKSKLNELVNQKSNQTNNNIQITNMYLKTVASTIKHSQNANRISRSDQLQKSLPKLTNNRDDKIYKKNLFVKKT